MGVLHALWIVPLYGALAGAAFFIPYEVLGWKHERAGALEWKPYTKAIGVAVLFPLTLPAMLTYLALYRQTDEYCQKRLEDAEDKLEQAIEEARKMEEK